MLVFMACPPLLARPATTTTTTATNSTIRTTTTTHSRGTQETAMLHRRESSKTSTLSDESNPKHPPQSMLSLSTVEDASASPEALYYDVKPPSSTTSRTNDDILTNSRRKMMVDESEEFRSQYTSQNCCGGHPALEHEEENEEKPTISAYLQRMEDRLYENTVHGPCQGVMCEVDQIDLFTNCQQPFAFLGFGRHPGDSRYSNDAAVVSYHNVYDEEVPMPLPGAYSVPVGCEYCGASSTSQCDAKNCLRPKLFFQKKRPPFAPRDSSLWDPETDLAIINNLA